MLYTKQSRVNGHTAADLYCFAAEIAKGVNDFSKWLEECGVSLL